MKKWGMKIVAGGLSIAGLFFANGVSLGSEVLQEGVKPLRVFVDDFQGRWDIDSKWEREIALREAMWDVDARMEDVAVVEWNYNDPVPKEASEVLFIRVFRWEKSRTGFFEVRAFGIYYDEQGVKHPLGAIHGTQLDFQSRSFHRTREAYQDVMEEAFQRVLEKTVEFKRARA